MTKLIERHIRISSDSNPRLCDYLSSFNPKALTREILLLMEFGLLLRQQTFSPMNSIQLNPTNDQYTHLEPKPESLSESNKEPHEAPIKSMNDDFDIGSDTDFLMD